MNDTLIAKPYHDILNDFKRTQILNKKYFDENVDSYNLFYDFASSASTKDARSVYEKEAVIVDKIGLNASNLNNLRNTIPVINLECLLEKMKLLSRSHNDVEEDKIVDTFLKDIDAVSEFRINHLDGINSRFDKALEMGNFLLKKSLSGSLVKVWAKEQKINLKNMQSLLQEWAQEKRSDFNPDTYANQFTPR